MNAALSGSFPPGDHRNGVRAGWAASTLIYAAFSALVFLAQGDRPSLGPDHLTYFRLADSIIASCPAGDFWREATSIRTFGVLLAYVNGWTGSPVMSMKVVLAVFSVLYLLAAELFFRLFTNSRWRAVLFALLSGFAVSFGIASWGITDSTALLPRTLVAPIVMFTMWFWLRFDGRPVKYLAFSFLVLGSLLHLSTFYVVGVLGLMEAWDFLVLRRMRVDRLVPAFFAGLLVAGSLLFSLEYAGVSSKMIGIQIPDMLRSIGFKVSNIETGGPAGCRKPDVAATARNETGGQATQAARPTAPEPNAGPAAAPPPAGAAPARDPASISAKEAWAVELSLRPWRNMPLPMVNVANALSSFALIFLLALAGMVTAGRTGFTRFDRLMLTMFVAVPVFALGPQTALWVLRSFTAIHPATIEEVRAISLVMIPALYFILRLFNHVLEAGGRRARLKAGAIVVAVVVLPLSMKGLPQWAREGILSIMATVHVVDPASSSSVANARSALGLSASAPLYYATQGVREWLARNAPAGSRILTDRDDMILMRDKIIVGPRQLSATTYYATPEQAELFLQTSRAMGARNVERVKELALSYDADFAVVPWRAEGAPYADDDFSVISVRKGRQ